MKWRVLKTVCAAVVTSALWTPSFSQSYYLVIGAFATQNDDIREFTSFLPGTFPDTSYTVNSNNNLMHFYVLKTTNKEAVLAKTQQLQKEIESKDGYTLNTLDEFNLNTKNALEEKSASSGLIFDPASVEANSGKSAENSSPAAAATPPKPKGKFFKFTVATEDGNRLMTEVHHVDLAKGKEFGSFNSETNVDILSTGKNQPMTLVCGVFGYKEVEKYLDYSNPSMTEGAYLDDDGAWVIPYTLKRVEKGDVSVMYNVSFYKDAVVMLPPSKKDLDDLVNMMRLNPNYVIKVHAHCNGKESRKIIGLGDSNNYFDINGSIEKKGSAKDLTNLRGEAIRTYITTHGIAKERVKIFGWGGSDMLVDKNDPHARLNDRIEIEILAH